MSNPEDRRYKINLSAKAFKSWADTNDPHIYKC